MSGPKGGMGTAQAVGTASGASPTRHLSAQGLLWEAGPAQDARSSLGLGLSLPTYTMVQNRVGLPEVAPGSQHSLTSGNSSPRGTLSDLCPCDPGLPPSLHWVSLTPGAPIYHARVAKQLPPSARTALLPVQEVSPPSPGS